MSAVEGSPEAHSAGGPHRCAFEHSVNMWTWKEPAAAALGNLSETQFLVHTPDLLSQKLWGWRPAICALTSLLKHAQV